MGGSGDRSTSHYHQTFPRRPACAVDARHFVRNVLAAVNDTVDVEAAVLLTGELVANTIRHAGGDRFEVDVDIRWGEVRIGVSDADPTPPVLQPPDPDALGGRGLPLVERLSEGWGTHEDDNGGKCVWFRLRTSGGHL